LSCLSLHSLDDAARSDYEEGRQDRGVIINIGSVCASQTFCRSFSCLTSAAEGSFIGLPNNASYNATKHAVAALTKTMAIEHAADGIRCNVCARHRLGTAI
jgi:NAD(P)-dependent dehydrogenase (short-subunit alcohol dehydrogenase family)